MAVAKWSSNKKPIEPIYKDRFVYSLIGLNTTILNISDSITLKSSKDEDVVDCEFFFDSNNISNFDSNSFLKDVKYILLEIFTSTGQSIKNILIKCEFISFEVNFNTNDSNILKVILKMKSLLSINIREVNLVSLVKSLQRDIKIDSLF